MNNMDFMRKHWYDLGIPISIATIVFLIFTHKNLTAYQIILWLSFVSLLFHQLEEYRIDGTFPGMVNRVMYKSELPDRFPLNTDTSLKVNVFVGWLSYFLAAVLNEKAIWLAIATMMVSLGNIIAHTIVFNIKGKTIYNAGMATAVLLFLPCSYTFCSTLYTQNLASTTDYLVGIPLGIVLNVVGIVKLIDWGADKNTPYIFGQRNLLPSDRNKKTAPLS